MKYTSLLFILLAAFAACRDEVSLLDPDEGKSPIELSVGGMDVSSPSQTRAVITDGTNKTLQAFDENTSLYMLMKSEDVSNSSNPAKVTRTIMFALRQTDDSKDYSEVNYSASNQESSFVRYWEDSYSRSSALSVLAVCTPGMGPGGANSKAWSIGNSANYENQSWTQMNGDTNYPTVKWPIGNKNQIDGNNLLTDQSGLFDNVSFIKNQDLCFSNNIGKHGENDKRLKYDFANNKRFPRPEDKWDDGSFKTRMIFYHALSKLTFQIKKGEGFTDADFTFDKETVNGTETDTNIKLKNFNNSGTFNIEEGEFINTTLSSDDIRRIYQHPSLTSDETNAGYKYILDALVIPGTNMDDAETTGVVFRIAGNEYKLSMKQLYDAIIDNSANSSVSDWSKYFDKNSSDVYSLLKAGVHYVFTFTVGKTKIEKITAQLVPWEEVTSIDFDASNARIQLDLLTTGTPQTESVKFYRALNEKDGDIDDTWESYDWLNKQYETDEATYSVDHWTTTNWLWESNRHFYHFRALMPDDVSVENNGDTDPNPTFNLQSKKFVAANDTYNDVKWGAPFKQTSNKLTYSTTKGFDGKAAESSGTHQIYKAIGPTKETINLVSFHMMSQVTIKVQTTANFDNVDFDGSDNNGETKVELLNCYQYASGRLGDGLVSPTGDKTTIQFNPSLTSAENTQTATWGIVPQSLSGVQLRITTADGNQYIVDMDKIKVNPNKVTNKNLANPYHVITEDEIGTSGITADDVGKCIVDYWYPDYQYSYTFTLTKKGIKDLVATIVDWETVTADDETVQIQ